MKNALAVALALLFCLVSFAAGAEEPGEKTKRIFLMGSSLTDQVKPGKMGKLAESRGYQQIWGKHSIPGAPIRIIWKARDLKRVHKPFESAGKALKEFEWDAVTIEPRNGYEADLEAACKFIDYTLEKSPEVQFYVFAQWPRTRRGSYDTQWLSDSKDIQNNIRLGFEEFLKDMREQYADIPNPPLMVPAGHAKHLLELKIQAGLVPGMNSIYDGYSDGSHLNPLGEYIVGCTFFATIYRESPIGLPTEPYCDIPADLAAVIQETVWEAVNAHPLSGVKADGDFRIITPWFPAAVKGAPFSRELHSAFGKGEVTWTLEEGSPPPGITVDPKGMLTGTARETGEYTFTLKAVDAEGEKALRRLKLACVRESVPVIPEQTIPVLGVGEHLDYQLQVEGGNGDISWRILSTHVRSDTAKDGWKGIDVRGKVLPGLTLSINGVVSGAPAKAGVYKSVFSATDADPNEPDTAERELLITVGPPGRGVCLADHVAEGPEVDGNISAAFGPLDCSVTKPVIGEPSCSARFTAIYDRHKIYIAVEVQDEKVVTGSEHPWEDDSIEIYFDRNNNKEKEYNSDDCRIVCSVSGKVYTYNLEEHRATCAFKKTETGYAGEIRIQFNGRRKPNTVYGFDLGVNDNDGTGETGRIMWKGTAENETDPSGFGALVLREGN